MQSKELIKKNIELIKHHQVKLYSYLYDLVDKPLSVDSEFLENIYCGFLNDDRSEIKRISIYALLFFLKIKKDKYKLVALQWAQDVEKSEELRLFSMAGLSQAYMGSKDPQLLSFFFDVFTEVNEYEDLRASGFEGMMKVLGLSTIDIMQKNQNKLIIAVDDVEIGNFRNEIDTINKLRS